MVDGAIVLVDAAEGPMPQTKFVVGKALKVGLKPIVVINKIDRPDARHVEVINEVFDLFAALDATDEQLDFPILYGSAATAGWPKSRRPKDQGLAPLFDLVSSTCPPPTVEPVRSACSAPRSRPIRSSAASSPAASTPARSSRTRRSRCCIRDGSLSRPAASKMLAFRGLERQPIEEAQAATSSPSPACRRHRRRHVLRSVVTEPLQAQPIDPPTCP
jgi:GTP-binding protein